MFSNFENHIGQNNDRGVLTIFVLNINYVELLTLKVHLIDNF